MNSIDRGIQSIEESFFLHNFNLDTIFALFSRSDYYIIQQIRSAAENSERSDGVYLYELANLWNANIPDTSRILKRLEEKGYIYWGLDERKEHTWVRVTKHAIEQLSAQQARMKSVYYDIIKRIPREDLQKTFETMKQIRELINSNERFI